MSYAQRFHEDSWYFAISVLEEVRTPVAILAIAELGDSVRPHLDVRMEDAQKIVCALTNSLLGKPQPRISESVRVLFRDFLHAFLAVALKQVWISSAIASLGKVGDSSSLSIIRNIQLSDDLWKVVPRRAIREIKKRCDNTKGDT